MADRCEHVWVLQVDVYEGTTTGYRCDECGATLVDCPECGEPPAEYQFQLNCQRCSRRICQCCAVSNLCPDCDVDAMVGEPNDWTEERDE